MFCLGRFAPMKSAIAEKSAPKVLSVSKFSQRERRTLGNVASCEAEKQRKVVSAPSVMRPVSRFALLKHSNAPGQVKPDGREKVAISFPSLALPIPNVSLFIAKSIAGRRKIGRILFVKSYSRHARLARKMFSKVVDNALAACYGSFRCKSLIIKHLRGAPRASR